ncbi:M15 family metallopeptidase [Aerococcus urinaeequi]|uniref:M15 family metallopeptidase n=1 Tax=Aerococcus urinaeequi TaxID=51665 RepID=UPI003D6B342B
MSKINMNHFNKAYIAIVLAFILALAAYDISYSKTNAETETTTNQPTDTKTTEESASAASSDDEKRAEARKAELTETITTPVASNATTDEEASQMAEFSADYTDDIQSFTVADIAASVASDLGANESATLDQLMSDLPADIDTSLAQYQLVNKLNPLLTAPVMDFAYASSGKPYNAAITDAYTALIDAAASAGYTLSTISAHRTIAYQAQNVENGFQGYLAQGYSESEARDLTNAYFAPAEASEHSTGLSFDWLGTEWTGIGGSLDEAYADQPSAQWLAENAQDYGFILRYPQGKEQVTGYSFEPWHYRYVGVEAAQYISKYDITLEEFLALVNYQNALVEEDLA